MAAVAVRFQGCPDSCKAVIQKCRRIAAVACQGRISAYRTGVRLGGRRGGVVEIGAAGAPTFMKPRFDVAKFPRLGKTVLSNPSLTPNHLARVAEY